jgi:hypothetical protein
MSGERSLERALAAAYDEIQFQMVPGNGTDFAIQLMQTNAIGRRTRWAALSDAEVGQLIGGMEAADREGSIDHAGKALWADLEHEIARRTGEAP